MKEVFDLSRFDSYKEDNRREVKKAERGLPDSLWETYSAFANCYGGVIILGVKEDKAGGWHTTGLKNAAKLKKDFWNTINLQNVSKNRYISMTTCLEELFGEIGKGITIAPGCRLRQC